MRKMLKARNLQRIQFNMFTTEEAVRLNERVKDTWRTESVFSVLHTGMEN